MKKKVILSVVSALLVLSVVLIQNETSNSQSTAKYVGVNTCVGACHKTEAQGKQLDIWKESKHSKAFEVLQTPEADKIATEKGFTTPAAETKECLKCHVLGKEMDESEFETSFDKTQGVQCETCHGAGSEYKKLSIMKDKDKAVASGLVIHTEKEAFCTHCHNSESPTFKEFKYDEMWEKIKHPIPAKE
ncbi:MAG: cytochrome C554 [Ignavibacteria bacterium]|nr:cytochrome C554 [Ignavibacteria bacterium]